MSDNKSNANENYEMDEEITVTLDLEDGTTVNCAVVTVLTIENQDYIALLPLEDNGDANKDGEVWFYRYAEDNQDPGKDPILDYIENDEEYERVAEAFDEFLDHVEFDEIEASNESDSE